MKLIIYISRNKNIKRIAKYIKCAKEELSDDLEISIVENTNKQADINEMMSADIIVILSHGGDELIYHSYTGGMNKNDILIDINNVDIFENKKVIALCCYTARKLGPYAVSNKDCISYLGFLNAINRELEDQKTPPAVVCFLSTVYGIAFKNTIIEAINNKLNFEQIRKYLKHEIQRLIIEKVMDGEIEGQKYDMSLVPPIVLAAGNTAEGIRCFGDINSAII